MEKPYIYNQRTHTLHIEGYCHLTRVGMYYDENTYKRFSSENEAVAYDKRSVSMCKLCTRTRENLIKSKK